MKLNKHLLEELSAKIGQDVTTPTGASVLQLDIESVTGETLSLNTVKRLVGVLQSDSITPRITTLNIIATYLGYQNWKEAICTTTHPASMFIMQPGFVDMASLEGGTRVTIGWAPNREIGIWHFGKGLYGVLFSKNSKLCHGDVLILRYLAYGFPFIADYVIREGHLLGSYQSAQDVGIRTLWIRDFTERKMPKLSPTEEAYYWNLIKKSDCLK